MDNPRDFFRRYGNLLKPDGTNQLQRLPPGLEAGYILPDERSLADLVDHARRLAEEIRFIDLNGHPVGDWRPFLDALVDPASGRAFPLPALEALLASRSDWPPHLALFLTFLKLFGHLQSDLNELPERHLAYFYEQALGLKRQPAAPDTVHLVFEPARNAPPTLLPAGTLLDAGKDARGQPLLYATREELLVSTAAVREVRRLVVDRDILGQRRFFTADAVQEAEGPSWPTFGRRQLPLDASQRLMTEAALGFALASPVLRMAEGARTVDIRVYLRAPDPTQAPATRIIGHALDLALTGAEGWLAPDSVEAILREDGGGGQPVLDIRLTVGPAAPAIVPHDLALHGPAPASDHPVLRCLVRGETGVYEALDGLIAERVALRVRVEGVRDLVAQNADGPLNVNQPMPMFGSQPGIGSPFYIGSAEVFGKRLESLDIHLEWQAPPEDLISHYQGYFDLIDANLQGGFRNYFVVELDMLYGGRFDRLLDTFQTLFAPTLADPKVLSATGSAVFGPEFKGRPYVAQPDLQLTGAYDTASRYGFVRLVLRGPTRDDTRDNWTRVPFEAFGHAAFPRRYANQAIALSRWTAGSQPELPNEPYTPVLKSLTLDYAAIAELIPGDVHSAERFFLWGPFGATTAGTGVPARLVPEIDGEAALLLGIEKIPPASILSLLFRIEAGTADAPEVLKSGETEWSCLSGDIWNAIPPSALLADSTQGFQQPGLIRIVVPSTASVEHEALPAGLVWLRALIRRPPESAARTLGTIRTPAATATLQPGANALADYSAHLEAGLPAAAITKLQKRNAAIKRVEQPAPSFDGRVGETSPDFFRRCGERLRHRGRAVTAWDLEHLVLERFPEVFKAKCLPHTDALGRPKAGETALVIIANLLRGGSSNPLEPRAGEVLMERIRAYLAAGLASPFAALHVIHPVYERIRVQAQVAFSAGKDPGYHAALLNEDLRRFLSPWAYQQNEDIPFGARIYRSEILAFVEGREYVKFVTGFQLYHSCEGLRSEGIGTLTIGSDFIIRPNPRPAISEMTIGEDLIVGRGVEVAETTQAHTILVSHPAHLITAIADETCPGVVQLGIGYMTVALDFRIAPELAR